MNNTRRPLYVDFSITPICNLNCSFCSASAQNNIENTQYLSLSKIKDIFSEFDELGVLRVSLEGGEPFLRNDIIEIMKCADQHNFLYYINTNGTLIDEKMAKKISNTNVEKICISIDGPNARIHDLCRGQRGVFTKAVNAIKYLLDLNIEVNAIITLTNKNKDYLLETINFLESIGVKSVAIMLLATVGNALTNEKKLALEYDDWKKTIIMLSELKISNKLPVNLTLVAPGESHKPWEIYLPLFEENKEEYINLWINKSSSTFLQDDEYGCTAGKDNFSIDGYGNVYGCSLMLSWT